MESLTEWLDRKRMGVVLSQNPKNISSKSEYYALHKEGYFGNRPQTWRDYYDFSKSDYNGLICIRSKVGIDRKEVRYDIPSERILENIKEMGLKLNEVSINESMPNEYLTIQGEIVQLDGRTNRFGLELRYSDLKKPMNIALKEKEFYLTGLNALLKIKGAMDPPSYENLNRLLEEFPDNCIEFSSFDIGVGLLGYNTVFWEVRNY